MSLLDAEIKKLKPSRPIYKVEVRAGYYGNNVSFIKEQRPRPALDQSDVIARLVESNYQEQFSRPGIYVVQASYIKRSSLNDIHSDITGFISNEFEQKHPLKTNIGRWWNESNFFRQASNNEEIEKTIVILWKYLVEKAKGGEIEERVKHKINVINVLSFLYEKYNKTYPTPEPMKRRKRSWGRRRR
jgi:hypothetical protein